LQKYEATAKREERIAEYSEGESWIYSAPHHSSRKKKCNEIG